MSSHEEEIEERAIDRHGSLSATFGDESFALVKA